MYENLNHSRIFCVEGPKLIETLAKFVQTISRPELLTGYDAVPDLKILKNFDAGVIHLTRETRSEGDIDRILQTKKTGLTVVVLATLSIVGDRGMVEVEELKKAGIRTYVNTDVKSYLLALGQLNNMMGNKK